MPIGLSTSRTRGRLRDSTSRTRRTYGVHAERGKRREPQSSISSPRVLYLQYTNPGAFPPLENSAQILASRGWSVRLVGILPPALCSLTFRAHPNICVQLSETPESRTLLKLHYLWWCVTALLASLRWRPDWIYVSDFFATPVGVLVSYRRTTRVLYHEHDAPPSGQTSRSVRVCLAARARLVRRADAVVVPSRERLGALDPSVALPAATFVVPNCPLLADAGEPPLRPSVPTRFVYHGALVPERVPERLVDALATLDGDWRLVLVGYETIVHPGYTARLRARAAEFGCADRLEIVGPVPRAKLFDVARRCHVGLALVPTESSDLNLQSMTGPSNKPFDYLASGLPVLVADLPAWRDMFVDPGYGIACDPGSIESLAAALRRCVENPQELSAMGARGLERVRAEWNYELQFQPVLRTLEAPVATRRRGRAATRSGR